MDNKYMGKVLKVFTNELTFGSNAEKKNVFGVFKYNNNFYIVYADVNNKYNVIYYGGCHVKGNSLIVLQLNGQEHADAVMNFIYKVVNKEELSGYEIINLDSVETMEIVGFSKLEIKKEIENSLIELTIPKVTNEVIEEKKVTKKNNPVVLIMVLLFLVGGIFGYKFYTDNRSKTSDEIVSSIICKKSYDHDELNATVSEERTFNFNGSDNLMYIDDNNTYVFKDGDSYGDFISLGLYLKYAPDDDSAKYKLFDDTYTYVVTYRESIPVDYKLPTSYEEVMAYYMGDNYNCEEVTK